MPTPLAVGARGAARRAARLPAACSSCSTRRSRSTACPRTCWRRRRHRSARSSGSSAASLLPGAALGRVRVSSSSRGCPRRGSRSSRRRRRRLPAARLPWLPDAAGAAAARGVHGARALARARSRRRCRLRGAAARCSLRRASPCRSASVVGAAVVGGRRGPATGTSRRATSARATRCSLRSGGATALIDTGPDPAALARCLEVLGVDRIDLLVLTHWDADHVGRSRGGASDASTPCSTARSTARGRARARARSWRRAPRRSRSSPVHRRHLGDARWRVLWPKPRAAPGNDASVVIDLAAPEYRARVPRRPRRGRRRQRMLALRRPRHGRPRQGGAPRSADQSERLYAELARDGGRDRRRRRQRLRASDRAPARPPRARRAPPRCAPTARGRRCSPRRRRRVPLWSERGDDPAPAVGLTRNGRCGGCTIRSDAIRGVALRRDVACEGPAIPQLAWNAVRPAPVVLVSRPRERARRARHRHAARVPPRGRSRARGERPRGRRLSPRRAAHTREPVAVRRAPAHPGDAPSKVRATTSSLDALEYLEQTAESTTLVLRHAGGQRGKKLLDAIRAGTGGGIEIVCAELKKDAEKQDFAAAEFRAAGRSDQRPGALRALVAAFADDLAELSAACRQLIADAPGDISEAVVAQATTAAGSRPTPSPSQMPRSPAVTARRSSRSGTRSTAAPTRCRMVAAFAMKVRTMAKVSGARGGGPQVASSLGLAPWQVDRARRDLAGWSDAGLRRRDRVARRDRRGGQGRRARSGLRARATRSASSPHAAARRLTLRSAYRRSRRVRVETQWRVRRCDRDEVAPGETTTAPHRRAGPSKVSGGVRARRPASRWPTCGSRPGSCG